jgi:hypothetical protein
VTGREVDRRVAEWDTGATWRDLKSGPAEHDCARWSDEMALRRDLKEIVSGPWQWRSDW